MEREKKPCWFTGEPSFWQSDFNTDSMYVDSEACGGVYAFTETLKWDLGDGSKPSPVSQAKINCARKSLQIHKENKRVIPIWTNRENVDNLKKYFAEKRDEHNKPPKVVCAIEDAIEEYVDHSEKPYLLLESFAQKLSSLGAYSDFKVTLQDRVWARAIDKKELFELLRFLESESLLVMDKPKDVMGISELIDRVHEFDVRMTVHGWQAIRQRNTGVLSNKVFIATQFNWPENSDTQKQAIDAIKSACRAVGYDADVVKQNHTDNITDRIMSEIKNSRFVVAELTYNNRGVYYEAGFARGLNIPVFHLVRKGFTSGTDPQGTKIHFDIQQIMYREWTEPADLESQLKDWIEATLGKYNG